MGVIKKFKKIIDQIDLIKMSIPKKVKDFEIKKVISGKWGKEFIE